MTDPAKNADRKKTAKAPSDRINRALKIAVLAVMPWVIWVLAANGGDISPHYILCNLLLILAVELVFFTVTANASVSALLTEIPVFVLYMANEIVWQLRGTPLMAKDIFSFRTAMSVAGDYRNDFLFNGSMQRKTAGLCITAVICVLLFIAERKTRNDKKRRIVPRVISLAAFTITCLIITRIDISAWDMNAFWHQSEEKTYGKLLCLYKEATELSVEKPAGYSKKELAEQMLQYENETPDDGGSPEKPNIIVIMNEALADFTVYDGFDDALDPLPNLRRMTEEGEIRSGMLHVSIWGGDTANTEWELLTQNSLINCPGSVPYNQYIFSDKDGLVSHLGDLGYSTTAIHPFFASGYDREHVYEYLGFDEFMSILDFDERYAGHAFCEYLSDEELAASPEGMYIRNKISDRCLYDKTIEVYEEKKKEGPVFIFDITMQNHGAYTYENYEGHINASYTGDENNDRQLSQYLSLEYESDQAYRELIDYFENTDEKVIILMFGDHQPSLADETYNLFQNKSRDAAVSDWTEEELALRYVIPYYLWTNFEPSVSDNYEELSANYLALMLQDYADLAYDARTAYMQTLFEQYPVVSAREVKNAAGERLSPEVWNDDGNREALLYRQIQYYYMFDK